MVLAAVNTPLVKLVSISKHFGEGEARVDALRNVSIKVYPGEVVALLGPSGSGKTTLLNVIGCILDPSAGSMELDGELVLDNGHWLRSNLRELRLDKIGFIFQFHNLIPFLDATDNISLVLHMAGTDSRTAKKRAVELLDYLEVGHRKNAMPAQLSGGEAQRVAIARALALNPKFIVCDEPVSALDVSVQAQVINLMQDLQKEFDVSFLFIAHDLSVVEHISARIAVMYLGHIVEIGTSDQVFFNPIHPYSRALLSAVPQADPDSGRETRTVLQGDPPTPLNKPTGCPFRTRCPIARAECAEGFPVVEEKEPGHFVACPYVDA